MTPDRILVVRLGAMGDVIHTLPAVSSLKQSFPRARITWLIESKWQYLLAENPFVHEVVSLNAKTISEYLRVRKLLRSRPFDLALDFQGLLKSAILASAARTERLFGYDSSCARERLAAWFYSRTVKATSSHVVDRNIQIVAAAGARNISKAFPLPQGQPEGELPAGDFVLASPEAGWQSKQWPIENYEELGARLQRELGLSLVLNGAGRVNTPSTYSHVSTVQGLIYATRRAVAVVGVDSGPLHIAAALNKPGVAIFGPTDPLRNGPYGSSITVLRAAGASTSYKRLDQIDPSMRAVTVDQVYGALSVRVKQAARR